MYQFLWLSAWGVILMATGEWQTSSVVIPKAEVTVVQPVVSPTPKPVAPIVPAAELMSALGVFNNLFNELEAVELSTEADLTELEALALIPDPKEIFPIPVVEPSIRVEQPVLAVQVPRSKPVSIAQKPKISLVPVAVAKPDPVPVKPKVLAVEEAKPRYEPAPARTPDYSTPVVVAPPIRTPDYSKPLKPKVVAIPKPKRVSAPRSRRSRAS